MTSPSPAVATFAQTGPIAVLTIDYPPVNALGQQVREAIAEALASVAGDESIEALVILCAGRTYFAGADIREFGKPRTPPFLPDLFDLIEACAKPVVTAIHGAALGGGLELAMACHFRLATQTAKLGLPEVTLGILPGAGGTQRLPRLIGIDKALEMLTTGRAIGAAAALELGLIDEIIDGDIEQGAIAFARSVAAQKRPVRRTRDRDDKLAAVRADPAIIDRFAAEHAAAFLHLDAPAAILKAVAGVLDPDFDTGAALERQLFLTLREGPQAAALRHAFFAEREAAKIPGLAASARPSPTATIGVIGEGVLAIALADRCRAAGCSVRRLEGATDAVDFQALADADLVVEATDGSMAAKRDLISRLGRTVGPDAMLASALTPDLDIDAITVGADQPERVLGLHALASANAVTLIEVVRGGASSDTAVASAMALAKLIGAAAVVAGNTPGFIGQRMLTVQRNQADALLSEGVSPYDIDRVAKAFGMAVGPFGLDDLAGLDRRGSGRREIGDADILERLHYPVINEGARILQEKAALRASDIDLVWLKACGWPAWTGGPMFHADRIGLATIVAGLHRFGVEPAALLVALAADQKSLARFGSSSA